MAEKQESLHDMTTEEAEAATHKANLDRDRAMREHYANEAVSKAMRACFEAIRKARREVSTYQRQASRWSSAVDDNLKKLAHIESALIKEA